MLFLCCIFVACHEKQHHQEQISKFLSGKVDTLLLLSKAEIDEHPGLSYTLADSALRLAVQIGYKKGEANALNRKGFLLGGEHKTDSALLMHRSALAIRRSLRDTLGMGYSYANLSQLFIERGVWNGALQYCDSAYLCFKAVGDTFQYIRRLQQKGVIALRYTGTEAALGIFLDYKKQASDFGDKQLIAEALMSTALTYYTLGQLDSSYLNIENSLQLYRELGMKQEIFELLLNKAEIFARKEEIEECAKVIAEADSMHTKYLLSPENSSYLSEAKFKLALAQAGAAKLIMDFEDYSINIEKFYEELNRKGFEKLEADYQLAAKASQNKQLFLEKQRFEIRYLFLLLILAVLLVLFMLMFQYFRNRRRRSLKEMELKERQIKDLIKEQELKTVNAALQGKDQERNRIAQELHDRLGYILSLAKLNFSAVQDDLLRITQENEGRFNRISEILDEASMEVRRISHDLYGSSVFNFGIVTAMHQLVKAVSAANKMIVRFHNQYVPPDIPQEIQVSYYRIAGELISNTLRHANARHIDIQLIGRKGELVLTYEDDGDGFQANQPGWKPGMGYSGIESRLQKLHGTYLVESSPGKGMYFQAEVPYIQDNRED